MAEGKPFSSLEKNSFSENVLVEDAGEMQSYVPTLSPEEEHKLYRKIDWRLLPILSLMYLLAFMDRGNIGNAKLEGLLTQLHMSSNDYTVALLMFFIPYCLCEPISNLLIKRVRPSRYLPIIAFIWGVVMTLMGIVKTFHQLVGVRVCLGVAEAGLFPGVVYFMTFWYPRHLMQLCIGLFLSAATVAGAFSGLLAYGISFMDGTQGLQGWSWIFILEGVATVAVSILAAVVLHGCDSPETASFLTPDEKAFIIYRQKFASGTTVAEDESLKKDILTYISVTGPVYAAALFLPSIINGFGYERAVSQLLTVPPFVFATIVIITFSYNSDKYKLRSPFILTGQIMALIGFIINITNAPRGVKYFGMFLCTAGAYAAFSGVVAWLGNNMAPSLKRGIGMAVQIGIGNFAGAISSSVYRAKDQPRYILGHGVEIGLLIMGIITVPVTVLIYRHINATRDALERTGEYEKYSNEEISKLGDRAPTFRYVL